LLVPTACGTELFYFFKLQHCLCFCLWTVTRSESQTSIFWFCFYVRKQLRYCFQRILAIAILSVRLSVTQVDQSKAVQARITKSSPSAAWKTLVSGTVKLFHKFEGSHPDW